MIILKQNGSSDCVIGLPLKKMQVNKQRKATLHESAKYKGYFQGVFSQKIHVPGTMLITIC